MTGPLHVLMTADAVGGIWVYALDLGRALVGRGVAVTVAVLGPAPGEAACQAAAEAGFRLVVLGHDPEWLAEGPEAVATAGQALAALATRSGANVIQLNHPALAAGVRFTQPVIAVCHSCVATWWAAVRGADLPPEFAWQAALVGDGCRAADVLVAPTQAFATVTAATYGLARIPDIVPNGRATLPEAGKGDAPAREAVTLGRLWDEGKGAAILEIAAPLTAIPIRAAGPTVGPNGAEVDLRSVERLGALSEGKVRALLAGRPIFVSAALYEPFGLSVLEAAQAGCALVLSDIPTLRELWDGVAVFVPARDPAGFAAAIDALASDPARRERLGRAARLRAGEFTVERQVERMLALYAGVAAARQPAHQADAA